MNRDIKGDYIAAYQGEYDHAVRTGNRRHADRVAEILAGYGVTVKPAKETTDGEAPPEDTAEPKPKRSKKK